MAFPEQPESLRQPNGPALPGRQHRVFKTCMSCKRPLGANEVVEEFPVGRRLAFDSAKGRLWVVCRCCERWNLTPLEERWEAVETCEKLFRETRLRTSTENIGLARHPEGLYLVRIGKPLRPEFAAWRYGDQFGRRRTRLIILGTTVGVAWLGGIAVASNLAVSGVVGGFLGGFLGMLPQGLILQWHKNKQIARFAHSDGKTRELHSAVRNTTRICPSDDDIGFAVETHVGKSPKFGWGRYLTDKREWFEGEDARRAMNAVLFLVNFGGGGAEEVRRAVSNIESHKHPQRFLSDVVGDGSRYGWGGVPGWIHKMPKPTRLALEMALHEEQERRALEGDLWRLERAWREAEEIAAISDNLLLPKGTEEFVAGHRPRQRTR